MTEDNQIEPGVLRVFRIFVGLELLIFSLPLPAVLRSGIAPNYLAVLMWMQSFALLVYLLLPWPRQLLGRRYLPVALVVASIWPIVAQVLATILRLRDGTPPAQALAEPNSLFLWLLLPLLLISVQYGYRELLAFTLGTSSLAALLGVIYLRVGGGVAVTIAASAGLRLVVFTLAGLIVVQLARAQREMRRELARKNERLAQLAATLEQLAASRERNRMARELHDTLAHTLSALSVQLNALDVQLGADPQAARQTLRQTQQLVGSGMQEARRVLHALRAGPLETLGLVAALRQAGERASADAGMQLDARLPERMSGLRPEVEQHLYRIADEALQNAARHSRGRCVELELCERDGQLVLRVDDDGVGFDAQALPGAGHYGLIGIRERAQLLGGQLLVQSNPRSGTRIQIAVPHPRGAP
jgi:signal transduction histidine kinase